MGGFIKRLMARPTLEAVQKLKPLATEAGVSLTQFALAWVLREPNVASAIIGASRPEQVDENAAASGLVIDPALFAKAEAIVAQAATRVSEHPAWRAAYPAPPSVFSASAFTWLSRRCRSRSGGGPGPRLDGHLMGIGEGQAGRLETLFDLFHQVEPGVGITGRVGPRPQRHGHRAVVEGGQLGPGGRVGHDARVGPGALPQQIEGEIDIVGVVDAEIHHDADGAGHGIVNDHFAERLAVGDEHQAVVEVGQAGHEEVEPAHPPDPAGDLDPVADAIGPQHQDHHPGRHVAEAPLQGQAHGQGRGAQDGDHRSRLHPQLLKHGDDPDDGHRVARQGADEVLQGRVRALGDDGAAPPPARPAARPIGAAHRVKTKIAAASSRLTARRAALSGQPLPAARGRGRVSWRSRSARFAPDPAVRAGWPPRGALVAPCIIP